MLPFASASRLCRLVCALFGTVACVALGPSYVAADSTASHQRAVRKLADGVYLILHPIAPDHFTEGNTTVIIGDAAVLVVDSCYLPSSAREDIAQIRQWTDTPVRYLVNTHWHNDHTQGNAAYAEAYPAINIVAQSETAKLIPIRVPAYIAEYPKRIERFKQEIATQKDPGGKPLTQAQIDDLKIAVSGGEEANKAVSAEFRNLKVRAPDLAFDRELDVNLGNRQVQLRFLGRGNTAGDAVAYLPKEKILVAGDLVDSPVPFLYGGFPVEQIETLKRMNELDFDTLIPGHGDVLKGKALVQMEIELLQAVVSAMTQEIARTSMDPQARFEEIKHAVEKRVDKSEWSRRFAPDDADERDFFEDFSWPGLLLAVHAELWPR
jgi:cyclase